MRRLYPFAAAAALAGLLACTESPEDGTKPTRYVIRDGNRFGFIDNDGRVVIAPQFDDAQWFAEGLAPVKVGSRWGFIDEQGKIVINPLYDEASPLYDGLAAVKTGERWGFIDRSGREVIPPQFDGVSIFQKGLAGVRVGERWGYIDKKGKFVINPQFDFAFPFSRAGLALVTVGDDYGFVDRKGAFAVNPRFTLAHEFREGLAAVRDEERWGFIDTEGRMVIPPQFDGAGHFLGGYAPVKSGGRWGYIDRSGKYVINPRFENVGPFADGIAAAFLDGRCGFIDLTGKFVVKPQFKECYSPHGQLLPALLPTAVDSVIQRVYLDRTGRELWRDKLPAVLQAGSTPQVHTVRMIGDARGYRFEPAHITISEGDTVKWVMTSGGPHSVEFQAVEVPAGAKTRLAAAMNNGGRISGPLMMTAGDVYAVSFAGLLDGTYGYECAAHREMAMKGTITVQ
jgi:plastocyanin